MKREMIPNIKICLKYNYLPFKKIFEEQSYNGSKPRNAETLDTQILLS